MHQLIQFKSTDFEKVSYGVSSNGLNLVAFDETRIRFYCIEDLIKYYNSNKRRKYISSLNYCKLYSYTYTTLFTFQSDNKIDIIELKLKYPELFI